MDAALRAGLRRELAVFLVYVFRDLHPGAPPLEVAWYLRAICHALTDACEKPGSRLVISVPPRHLKSIAASVALPAFLLGRDPTRRIMVVTYNQELARQHAMQCRRIMEAAWYRELFPHTRIAEDGNRLFEVATTELGYRKAISVGGTITGMGADVIIVDDCMKPDEARSDTRRAEAKAWYDGTLANRINQLGRGAIVSIAQRLHEDDINAYLLGKGFKELCLPAIATKSERIRLGANATHHRSVGDLLGRSDQSRDALEAERLNMGPQVFSAQFQQDPAAPEGNLIRLEWFGSYDEPIERDRCYRVIQSWDTGMSDEPTSDYSVCTTWGYLDRKWHLLDVLRKRLAYPDLKRAVLRQHQQWRPDHVIIEDAGSGKSLWQELRLERMLRPIMWRATEDKETRLIGITGQLEAGLCVLPNAAPWLEDFRHELRAFPHGRHDDQVDSMTQFLQYHIARGRSLLAERDSSGRKLWVDRPPRRSFG